MLALFDETTYILFCVYAFSGIMLDSKDGVITVFLSSGVSISF